MRDPAPRKEVEWRTKEAPEASAPTPHPGYTARRRTLPNGVFSRLQSNRSVDPVDPKYDLPKAPMSFPDALNRSVVRAPLPGTVRPRWDDLSDIPGASRQIQYVRPTHHDSFRYDDVQKGTKKWAPRTTELATIDVGKRRPVPFDRSIPSNPLSPEYKYDDKATQRFEFNASMRLGLRGTMRGSAGHEMLGKIGQLRHAGLGGPQPENARSLPRERGIKKMYTGIHDPRSRFINGRDYY